jgi:hypothetical protein
MPVCAEKLPAPGARGSVRRVTDASATTATSRKARAWGWLGEHAYLVLAAAAALVLTRTVEFSPPPLVRVDPMAHGGALGGLPVQEFSEALRSPQVVQLKATLRRYDDRDLAVAVDSHALDDRGELLSQPVVTTPLGTGAAIEQTVRLERGALELDLRIFATPRLASANGQAEPVTRLEHQISIHSRREGWAGSKRRVHIDTAGSLDDVEAHGHRLVFSVDEHLFSLDLELHRPLGAV